MVHSRVFLNQLKQGELKMARSMTCFAVGLCLLCLAATLASPLAHSQEAPFGECTVVTSGTAGFCYCTPYDATSVCFCRNHKFFGYICMGSGTPCTPGTRPCFDNMHTTVILCPLWSACAMGCVEKLETCRLFTADCRGL